MVLTGVDTMLLVVTSKVVDVLKSAQLAFDVVVVVLVVMVS